MLDVIVAADMPRKSFLLVPLEATDPVVEDDGGFQHGAHSTEVSPTPRKSLFEMDAEDLRAAEQAWLDKVGSFRIPSPHVALCAKEDIHDLPIQQHDSIPPDPRTSADGADIAAAPPCMSSCELFLPEHDVAEVSQDWEAITAYREPETLAGTSVSEAQLLNAEQASSTPIHNSLTLRQRFSFMQAANASISSSTSALPSQNTTQDIALPKAQAPAGRSVGHDGDTYASDQEVSDADQNAETSDPAASEVFADPSKDPSIAAENYHMPRTPWMNLKTVRRPSASWRRVPQLPVQEAQNGAGIDTPIRSALPDEAQEASSMPTSGGSFVPGAGSSLEQQHMGNFSSLQSSGNGLYTVAAASRMPDDRAEGEHSAAANASDAKVVSTHVAQLGLSTPTSEQQIMRPDIQRLSSSWRDPRPNRLLTSHSVTSSLESAAPSAGDHLRRPHGQLSVSRGQADGSSTRAGADVTKERKARQLLRGKTPEECGVKMYERALAAEQRKQAR